MAKISSKDVLLYVNLGTDASPDWKIIGCSTTDGLSATTDSVSIATKCSGGFTSNQPGDKSWSFSNSSYLESDHDGTDYATDEEIFELWKNDSKDGDGELVQWKFESNDVNYEYYRMGRGFISDYSGTADQGDYLSRDLTITGSDELDNTPPTT